MGFGFGSSTYTTLAEARRDFGYPESEWDIARILFETWRFTLKSNPFVYAVGHHSTVIFEREEDSTIWFTPWDSKTTRERLNNLLSGGWHVFTHRHTQYLSDHRNTWELPDRGRVRLDSFTDANAMARGPYDKMCAEEKRIRRMVLAAGRERTAVSWASGLPHADLVRKASAEGPQVRVALRAADILASGTTHFSCRRTQEPGHKTADKWLGSGKREAVMRWLDRHSKSSPLTLSSYAGQAMRTLGYPEVET